VGDAGYWGVINSVQKIISNELEADENLISSGSVDESLKQNSGINFKKVLYWIMYICAVIVVVMYSHESEQGNIVRVVGKIPGIIVLIFLGVLVSNFGSFFENSTPSKFNNKYSHYILTTARIFFLSHNFKKSKTLWLNEIKSIDVLKQRNRITFHIHDPLEPTISFNGMRDVLKLAKLIEENLYYYEEHAYLKERAP